MTDSNLRLDALVIAAHPDDAEISLGGTILRLTAAGLKVGVLDLTAGEMGSRGTGEDRAAEASEASELLGLSLWRGWVGRRVARCLSACATSVGDPGRGARSYTTKF